MTSVRPLADRIALVTGASRGIGRAVALALIDAGAHVIALARSVRQLEELDDEARARGSQMTLVQLDLRNGEKVDAIGPSIYQRWGRLDILVANAGILGPLSPLPHVTADSWADVMAVNVTANWRLIRTCDPVLRRSDAGRAVFVTSGAAAAKRAYWGPYAASKAALEALARTYAHEVADSTVRVNLVNPGPVATQMRAKAFPGEEAGGLPQPAQVARLFVELASQTCKDNGRLFTWQPEDA